MAAIMWATNSKKRSTSESKKSDRNTPSHHHSKSRNANSVNKDLENLANAEISAEEENLEAKDAAVEVTVADETDAAEAAADMVANAAVLEEAEATVAVEAHHTAKEAQKAEDSAAAQENSAVKVAVQAQAAVLENEAQKVHLAHPLETEVKAEEVLPLETEVLEPKEAHHRHHLEKETKTKEALHLEIGIQVKEAEDTESEAAAAQDTVAVQAPNDTAVKAEASDAPVETIAVARDAALQDTAEEKDAAVAVMEVAADKDAAKAVILAAVAPENSDAKAAAIVVAQTNDVTIAAIGDKAIVPTRVKPHPEFPGIYQAVLEDGAKRLATKNFAPGKNVYGERLIHFEGEEYRVWDAFRSKLAGAILKGLKTVPILPGHKVLYLGAASGTTPSHISDIVSEEGHVYCVEFAQRSLRDLVTNVVAHRSNMSPFLADARMPQKYGMFIPEKLDDIYCDIAQPEQAKVLADNADIFLKKDGWVLLAVKSQSIDVTLPPSEVYQMEAKVLRNRGFQVEQVVDLEPYDIAHAMIVAQR